MGSDEQHIEELRVAVDAHIDWMRKRGVVQYSGPIKSLVRLDTGETRFCVEHVNMTLGPEPPPPDPLQERLANAKDDAEREVVREEIARVEARTAKQARRDDLRMTLASSRPNITNEELDRMLGEST